MRDLWERFETTGEIRDYLRFREEQKKRNESASNCLKEEKPQNVADKTEQKDR